MLVRHYIAHMRTHLGRDGLFAVQYLQVECPSSYPFLLCNLLILLTSAHVRTHIIGFTVHSIDMYLRIRADVNTCIRTFLATFGGAQSRCTLVFFLGHNVH